MEARLEGADFGGAHSVGAVFSWSSGDAKTQLPAGVPAILGHALVPLNTADFSSYLRVSRQGPSSVFNARACASMRSGEPARMSLINQGISAGR
jgi:hypothetical protein